MQELMRHAEILRGAGISVFGVVLFCAVSFVLYRVGFEPIERSMRRLAGFLLRRGLFQTGLEAETRKLDFLRILTGLVLVHRTFNIAIFILPEHTLLVKQAVCIGISVLAVAFTVGLFTPLVALLLLFGNVYIVDTALSTYTLGTDVLAMMMLVFAWAPAGTSMSLDSLIVTRNLPGARAVRLVYGFFGVPSELRMIVAKWAMMLSYSLLCLYSVLMHLHEPLWLDGDAAVFLLSFQYLSKPAAFFQHLFAQSSLAVHLARLAMIGMVAWYFYFLLFILIGGWFRRFVVAWSVLFFFTSMFILQLGSLAYFEFIFLAMLFWNRAFLLPAGGLEILYDDRCNLCDRTVRTLRLLDIFRVLEFRPLSKNEALLAKLGLTREAALRDLYGIDRRTGKVFAGYAFYAAVARHLLTLVWLVPIFWLARVTGIGPAIYRFVADRRIRWFGVCQLPRDYSYPADAAPLTRMPASRSSRAMFSAYFSIYAVLAIVFVAGLPHSTIRVPAFALNLAHEFTVAPIDVFNSHDLRMSSHWFTVEAVRGDGTIVLLPVTAADGSRLNWQKSDRVYFGNTLSWRRSKLVNNPVCYVPTDTSYIRQQLDWFLYRDGGNFVRYRVTYYYQAFPTIASTEPFLRMQPIAKVCDVMVDAGGNVVSASRPPAAKSAS